MVADTLKDNHEFQLLLSQIAGLLRENASVLHSILDATSASNQIIFLAIAAVSEQFDDEMTRANVVNDLEKTTPFKTLLRTIMSSKIMWEVLIGISKSECSRHEAYGNIEQLFTSYIAKVLLRAIIAINLRRFSDGIEPSISDFISFLTPGTFERNVIVPLHHIRLSAEVLDLGSFGRLRAHGIGAPNDEILEFAAKYSQHPRCSLSFTIPTKKFMGVTQFPISNRLSQRIAVIRLATTPFVSINHFSISHRSPWERPLHDSRFHSRFWGESTERTFESQPHMLEGEKIKDLESIFNLSKDVEWERTTPWRLAVDRLDDAMFKVECGSPDAILDIMIGIEGLFVEQSSRQECSHKVATRLARFLSIDRDQRFQIFKAVKRLYGVRSTLAHGQPWKLDESGMNDVGVGANLLCRSFEKNVGRGHYTHLSQRT
jgi:hypothetical protein